MNVSGTIRLFIQGKPALEQRYAGKQQRREIIEEWRRMTGKTNMDIRILPDENYQQAPKTETTYSNRGYQQILNKYL